MDWVKVGVVSGGLGVGDDQMEKWDVRRGRTKPFQNATDIGRVAAVVGGAVIGNIMPRWGNWGEHVTQGAGPLLVKSILKALSKTTSTASTASFAARRSISRPVPGYGADQGIIISST